MRYRNWLAIVFLTLAGCGGGGGGSGGTTGGTGGTPPGGGSSGGGTNPPPGNPTFQFDTGIGGSGGVIGSIDGFGSIILNGLELNTDDADFYIEGQSGFSQDDLREGYYVVVAGDISGMDAGEVFYRSNLKGPVSAPPVVVDALTGLYEYTVLGQTVVTSTTTRFDGVLAANVAEGDLLEVSGPIDAAGRVLASYIELENSLGEYKAIGTVANLDTTAETFDLGGLAVTYTGATLTDFDGAALADGQLVEVKMPPAGFTAPASATVSEVELLPVPQIEEGAEVEVEGLIDNFVSTTDFSVGGLAVTTDANTTYENGSVSNLAENVKIEVEGTVNASGVIVAEKIEFDGHDGIRVEGQVTGVDVAASTVTAMGITFEVRASTEMEDDRDGLDPFTLNDLVNGDYVEIRGFLEGNLVVAVELERDDPRTDARLRGPLTAFDKVASTVEIQGVTVNDLIGTTQYEDENENPVTRDDFYDTLLQVGQPLKADWNNFSSFADPADTLSLEDD